jgi:hypothetical protein
MNQQLLLDNLTNPALLFFALGILAVKLKSDLEIPSTTSKFISLYLLFSIGFKGGQELSHSEFSTEILLTIIFAILAAILIPVYVFLISKRKLGVENAGAIAASYGSVSAVTFVTALNFLETLSIKSDGHMVAVMALMEAPAIIIGVLLIRSSSQKVAHDQSLKSIFIHSLTNSSVLLILGSLIIGYLANEKAAEGNVLLYFASELKVKKVSELNEHFELFLKILKEL